MPDIDTLPHDGAFESFSATIPLARLILSGLNVRKTERDADVASLAEDIAARGLKQNLVVVPASLGTAADWPGDTKDRRTRFEVIAGGRRMQAMRLLADAGRFDPETLIPCLVEPRSEATETSLSENLHRVAMNPADEFEAFAAIVIGHAKANWTPGVSCPADTMLKTASKDSIAYCAKRFGVSVKHVTERLRLADLAPEILEALRKNAITLDSAKAYAGTSDHAMQIKVFLEQLKPGAWRPHDPATVRNQLRGETVSLQDPRVAWVGIDAYRAAGGRTECEMFMGTDGEERLLDGPLLDKLARAKAEKALPAWRKKEGWKDALLVTGSISSTRDPKAPEGFQRSWDLSAALTKTARKQHIAIVRLNQEGTDLKCSGHFKPEAAKAETAPQRDWLAERLAARRAEQIDLIAAHMAAAPVLEALPATCVPDGEVTAAWPDGYDQVYWTHDPATDPDEERDPTIGEVTVMLRLPRAAIEHHRAEAERIYDAEQKAEAQRKAAAEAAMAESRAAVAGNDEMPDELDDGEGLDEDEGVDA